MRRPSWPATSWTPAALGTDRPVWRLHGLFATPRAVDPSEPRPSTLDLGPTTTAEIIFTSGATAEPKGVVHHASQRPREHRADRARDGEVPASTSVRSSRSGFSICCRSATCSASRWRPSCRRCSKGSVIFIAQLRPDDIVRQIQRAPHLGARLRAEDARRAAGARAARMVPEASDAAAGRHALDAAMVALPPRAPAVRLEVLGDGRRRGAARPRARGLLGQARIPRGPGLRPHGNRADRHAESSAPAARGAVGKPIGGVEVKIADGRRDPRARRERHARVFQCAPRKRDRPSRTAGFTRATSANSTPQGQLHIRGRKKEMIVTPGRAQRLSGGRRAGAERAAGRPRIGSRRAPVAGSAAERVQAVLVVAADANVDDDRSGGQRRARGSSAHPHSRRLAGQRAAADRRHAQAETTRAPAVAGGSAAGRAGAWIGWTGRPVDSGAVRAGSRDRADHDDRRAGPQLARARRVDDGAGRGVSGHARRGGLRRRHDRRRSRGTREAAGRRNGQARGDGRLRSPHPRTRPLRFPRGIDRSPFEQSAARACRRGFCRSAASLRESPSRGSSISNSSTGRSSSPPITRATWTRRSFSIRCRRGFAIASRRRWRRSSSSRTSIPEQFGRAAWFTNSLNYYLAAFFFNAFPLPQREAGTRQTLRYIGDLIGGGYSVLIFPEGKRTQRARSAGSSRGIGMIASRLDVPVVPVRLEGLDRILHLNARFPTVGPWAVCVRGAHAPPAGRTTTPRLARQTWSVALSHCKYNRSG